jgi:HEAT repeat protein
MGAIGLGRNVISVINATQAGLGATRVLSTGDARDTFLTHPELPSAFQFSKSGPGVGTGVLKPWVHPRYRVSHAPTADTPDPIFTLVAADRYLSILGGRQADTAEATAQTILLEGPLTQMPSTEAINTVVNDKVNIEGHEQHQRQSEILDVIARLLTGSQLQQEEALKIISTLDDPELADWVMPFLGGPLHQLAHDTLAGMGDDRVIHITGTEFRGKCSNPKTCQEAILNFKDVGASFAKTIIRSAINSKDAELQEQAILGLLRRGDELGNGLLHEVLTSDDRVLSNLAIDIIGNLLLSNLADYPYLQINERTAKVIKTIQAVCDETVLQRIVENLENCSKAIAQASFWLPELRSSNLNGPLRKVILEQHGFGQVSDRIQSALEREFQEVLSDEITAADETRGGFEQAFTAQLRWALNSYKACVALLGVSNHANRVGYLQGALDHEHSTIQEIAIQALTLEGSDQAYELVAEVSKIDTTEGERPRRFVVDAARGAVFNFTGDKAVADYTAILEDTESAPQIRAEAAKALAKSRHKDALEILTRNFTALNKDEEDEVGEEDPETIVLVGIIEALGILGNSNAIGHIIKLPPNLLMHSNVQRAALKSLLQLRDIETYWDVILRSESYDKSQDYKTVRRTCISDILKLTSTPREDQKRSLIEAITMFGPPIQRGLATRALALLKTQEAYDTILEAIKRSNNLYDDRRLVQALASFYNVENLT